ncbi:hypothetical protein PIB30_069295 [Stylosanthes scabra]|uniref:Uncharacterized protein n=1 Tax=Stylosanthes scabra TaxID=79078 RepID=A0ABU6QP66_9FABA|nr:hypothetical protein [Stylosanthes scabra]
METELPPRKTGEIARTRAKRTGKWKNSKIGVDFGKTEREIGKRTPKNLEKEDLKLLKEDGVTMELPAAFTDTSGTEIQRRLLRWNRDGEKNIFVYALWAVDFGKVAGKLEKSGG